MEETAQIGDMKIGERERDGRSKETRRVGDFEGVERTTVWRMLGEKRVRICFSPINGVRMMVEG